MWVHAYTKPTSTPNVQLSRNIPSVSSRHVSMTPTLGSRTTRRPTRRSIPILLHRRIPKQRTQKARESPRPTFATPLDLLQSSLKVVGRSSNSFVETMQRTASSPIPDLAAYKLMTDFLFKLLKKPMTRDAHRRSADEAQLHIGTYNQTLNITKQRQHIPQSHQSNVRISESRFEPLILGEKRSLQGVSRNQRIRRTQSTCTQPVLSSHMAQTSMSQGPANDALWISMPKPKKQIPAPLACVSRQSAIASTPQRMLEGRIRLLSADNGVKTVEQPSSRSTRKWPSRARAASPSGFPIVKAQTQACPQKLPAGVPASSVSKGQERVFKPRLVARASNSGGKKDAANQVEEAAFSSLVRPVLSAETQKRPRRATNGQLILEIPRMAPFATVLDDEPLH